MRKSPETIISALKAEAVHDCGRINIRLSKNSKNSGPARSANESRDCPSKALSGKTRWVKVSSPQPPPKIPGITRKMVRDHLPKLLKNGILSHQPATSSEWLRAEWHLARELNLSPLRMAHLVSDPIHSHRHNPMLSSHRVRLLSAR